MPSEALRLYKSLLRASANFSSYNFRNYAFRRIRDGFLVNRNETDATKKTKLLEDGYSQLALIRRQTAISQMYSSPDLVVEK